MPLLSVIIPVYNEEKTVEKIIRIIDAIDIDKEIIIVNDASTDKTQGILQNLKLPNLKIFSHRANRGKGAAFKTGLLNASGEIVIIQDADLEYDPRDYPRLLAPIINGCADLVLGIRFSKGYKGLLMHRLGNLFLTGLHNFLYGSKLSDVYTCYKAARRVIYNGLALEADGFSLEQEIVSKALRRKLRIQEIPIAYHPRGYSQGKKIRYYDAFKIILRMICSRFKSAG